MAVGLAHDAVLAAAADGRSSSDSGLTLFEWAVVLRALGATDALNLDGGSSSSLVTSSTRRNQPRDNEGTLLVGGYPSSTALTFEIVPSVGE